MTHRVILGCIGSSVPWGSRLSILGRSSLQGVASYCEHYCLPSPLALPQQLKTSDSCGMLSVRVAVPGAAPGKAPPEASTHV